MTTPGFPLRAEHTEHTEAEWRALRHVQLTPAWEAHWSPDAGVWMVYLDGAPRTCWNHFSLVRTYVARMLERDRPIASTPHLEFAKWLVQHDRLSDELPFTPSPALLFLRWQVAQGTFNEGTGGMA